MGIASETRHKLIVVAERLIAERGVHAVALREIAVEAGQRNTGVVQYHFGSKQGLIDAILEHRMTVINRRRLAMLDEIDAAGLGEDPHALMRALVVPMSETLGDGGHPTWYLRFCAQVFYSGGADILAGPARGLDDQEWTQGLAIIQERVDKMLAPLPEPLRADRWLFCTGSITHALADRETRSATGSPNPLRTAPTPVPLFVAGLVDAAVTLLTAPVREDTLRLAGGALPGEDPA
jgi:AcrR family transcriptional regulator